MTSQQTVWPAFPLTLPYNVVYPPYVPPDNPCWMVPSQLVPYFHNRVIENQLNLSGAENQSATFTSGRHQRHKENRKFFLDKSVFDLVETHLYLALTDPKLLSWYLQLSAEDRKIILDEGGFQQFLQRHPALELSTHHVSVNYAIGSRSPVQQTIAMSNCRSKKPAATPLKPADPHLELEMLPNSVRENLALLGCGYTRPPPRAASPVIHLQDGLRSAYSSPVAQKGKDGGDGGSSAAVQGPAALAGASQDVDLERRVQRGNPELTDQLSATQRAKVTHAEGRPSACDGARVDQKSRTIEEHHDHMVCGSVSNEGSFSSEDQSSIFHSIMEEAVCQTDRQTAHNNVAHAALTDTRETTSPRQSHVETNTSEKSTSTVPCVATCDIMVATEVTPSASASTQSESLETADRNINTEVHMADLDYLAGEFIRIRTAQQKLGEHKENTRSPGTRLQKECACAQRAQRAELSLLTLHYNMCTQHCWRLYYTSAEGLAAQLTAAHGDITQCWPKQPPANIVSVLQQLESDYNRMREEIVAGVPLEHLKPLTVDSEKMMAGAGYTPAQIIGDLLDDLPSCSLKPQACKTAGEEHGGPGGQGGDSGGGSCQDGEKRDERVKNENRAQRRAVTLVPQVRGANHEAHKPEEEQTGTAGQELSAAEAWYDAAEVLEPERGQDAMVATERASDEAQSSALCVSNLPRDVTDSDVMLWFDQYCPSEVCVSVLKTGLRVAIVTVNGAQSAEAAVRGLNGFRVEGCTLHVEHITGAVDLGQSQTSASVSESSQDRTKAPPPLPGADRSSVQSKLTSLGSSVKHRQVVCISPTAKGTCVPQHFGTMGSFDTLMSELTRLHPGAGRRRIVDALVELRSRHQGVLSGLPLKTIREMASELLTGPENAATQL